MKARIAVIAGDGIGAEVIPQGVRALEAVARRFGHEFAFVPVRMGFGAWKASGSALDDDAIATCAQSDGILHGATGAADHEYIDKDAPPGWGRRQLSRTLGHCVSVRPIRTWPQTVEVSPIRAERIRDVDLVIVRDMTLINRTGLSRTGSAADGRFAEDILAFTEETVGRALRFSYLLARSRGKRLCLATQASLYATSRLWLQVFEELSGAFPDVAVEVQAPDNCAMQLIRNPASFDVIVTDSTPMGGMLNNLAAMIPGSIGMAPGASVALRDADTATAMVIGNGMYEPIHGSAPARAGQGIVNPIGTVLAAAMLLRHSLALEPEARAVESAVGAVLDAGYRTYDVMHAGRMRVGTDEMGARIAAAIDLA
jgi:3-isopropylmalate dehydrogenase